MKTLALIGDGIAARAFLAEFYHQNLHKHFKLTQYHAPQLAPAVSEHSTAIVALRGVLPGVSGLGDAIYTSYGAFRQFVQTHTPIGVEKIMHITGWATSSAKREQNEKRYPHFQTGKVSYLTKNLNYAQEEAYLIYPQIFLAELNKKSQHEIKKQLVRSLAFEGHQWQVVADQTQYYDVLVICAGAYAPWLLSDERSQKSKPIQGCFLSWKVQLESESFSYSLDDLNLIYRAQTQELLLGSTTDDAGFTFIPQAKKLVDLYQTLKNQLMPGILPEFSQAKMLTGLRHKGVKRLPYWGKASIGPQAFQIDSFYKNGWSFAFQAAQVINSELKVYLDKKRD